MIKERIEATRREAADAVMGTIDEIKENSGAAQEMMMEVVGLVAESEVTPDLEEKIREVADVLTDIHTEAAIGIATLTVTGFMTEIVKDL